MLLYSVFYHILSLMNWNPLFRLKDNVSNFCKPLWFKVRQPETKEPKICGSPGRMTCSSPSNWIKWFLQCVYAGQRQILEYFKYDGSKMLYDLILCIHHGSTVCEARHKCEPWTIYIQARQEGHAFYQLLFNRQSCKEPLTGA